MNARIKLYCNIIKVCHETWLKTKFLQIILNCAEKDDCFECPESFSVFWNLILQGTTDLFESISNGMVFFAIVHNEYAVFNKANEYWHNYVSLLDNLVNLNLARDYMILQDMDEFISYLDESLNVFQSDLQSTILYYTNKLNDCLHQIE